MTTDEISLSVTAEKPQIYLKRLKFNDGCKW